MRVDLEYAGGRIIEARHLAHRDSDLDGRATFSAAAHTGLSSVWSDRRRRETCTYRPGVRKAANGLA